jgi:formylglycine-generating enzyme required for sulfatase activity
MDSVFKKIVRQIIDEHGKEILESSKIFKAILLDCVRGEYKREVRVLTQLLDAGCYRKLCDAKDAALTKQQLVHQLYEDYGLDKTVAQEMMDFLVSVVCGEESATELESSPQTTQTAVQAVSAALPSGVSLEQLVELVAKRVSGGTLPQPVIAGMTTDFVFIQGGTFTMGSPASEKERLDWEGPQHQVTISKGFWMGKYEVTQKEWVEVMGSNPSRFKGDNLPVESVSWYEAIDYCNKRSAKEGLMPAYTRNRKKVTWNKNANGYRLPTEAEWEYACRAGTTTPFSTGGNITTDQANYYGNAKGTYRQKTWAVGSGAANSWGLYDMHGNVYEWCWDWYGSYASGSQTDPTGAVSGDFRVHRGGCWNSRAQYLRSAGRVYSTPSLRYGDGGFRLVRP